MTMIDVMIGIGIGLMCAPAALRAGSWIAEKCIAAWHGYSTGGYVANVPDRFRKEFALLDLSRTPLPEDFTFDGGNLTKIVEVFGGVSTICIPTFVNGEIGQISLKRTDECVPFRDGLAVVFR